MCKRIYGSSYSKLLKTANPIPSFDLQYAKPRRDGKTLVILTKRICNFDLAESTAYRYVSIEKKLFDSEIKNRVLPADRKALHIQPNMYELDLAYKKAKLPEFKNVPVLKNKMGRPYVFDPALYGRLRNELEEVKDVVGFGPVLVGTLAGLIMKLVSSDDDESLRDPSIEWSRWFLREQMGYSVRRITSHLYDVEARAKQEELHALNLDFLAKQISEHGLSTEFIFCSDEVGVNLQPSEIEKWVKKGSKVVASSLTEDKRSFTANVFGNAAGKVIGHHQIFAGKTTMSLPRADIRQKYEVNGHFFGTSLNH